MKPGAALQMIMDDQGISHLQLAARIGVSDRCVDQRVSDKNVMKMDTLVKMYDGVGYKIVAAPKSGEGREFVLDCE